MRKCGILLPIFSLPSKYGIGSFSKEAYKFIDFLKTAGQHYWQILPLGPTGYGDSPYQSFSTFAGNPYFIDVDEFVKLGYITNADCRKYSADNGIYVNYINYSKLYDRRYKLLRKAYENSGISLNEDYNSFCHSQAFWLDDYALYMSVKAYFDNRSWPEWDEDIRKRNPEAVSEYTEKLAHEIGFHKFLQYFFNKQWAQIKKYANENGVEIVGDIPIYVAFDSADTWANPELFDLNDENMPNSVAGCPPDYFSATGQLWGNPLYRWDYHKKSGYDWWLKRISHCYKLYDVVRIDHFRGFDEYYAIPYGMPTAETGEWRKGPGIDLFNTIKEKLGEKSIIAEDLGLLTDSVRKLVKATGYPGMKILLFAFDSDEKCEYLPHNVGNNSVIYTGTHDNDTARGWYEGLLKSNKKVAKKVSEYAGESDSGEMAWALIKMAYASVCDTCIIPMQDVLNLNNSARINTPSKLGGNWEWRMDKKSVNKDIVKKLLKLKLMYNR